MTSRTQSYYELLDILPDAKREEIALGYQRALEALAQVHDTDPKRRAALRKAFEVLSDPIQRMSYDLSALPRESAARFADQTPSHDDDNAALSQVARIWESAWGKVLVAALILIVIVMWAKSGKPAAADAASGGALQSSASTGAPVSSSASSSGSASAKSDTKSTSASTAPSGPRTAEDIFSQVSLSVVRIIVTNSAGSPVASGSGVVIGPGSVITNCHVAMRGDSLEVTLGGASYSASVEVANEDRDLCLLDVSGLAAPAVSLGSVDALRVGQRVYAVGAPQGLDLTISDGIVSALRESQGSKIIQTTAPVSPGSSGGGLFDTAGRMVGVVTFQNKVGQNLNFALPADWVGEMRTR
ncbi:MAG: trypsin-like peptidase domain-containing protein [Burkholderiales bacterium]|nr:trypsin-like peptidase domain-containing protein [Burkholderiales bacterium]